MSGTDGLYLANAVPGDFGDIRDHEGADDEQRATHSVRRDVCCRCNDENQQHALAPTDTGMCGYRAPCVGVQPECSVWDSRRWRKRSR
jgi:hypothetical protein